MTFNKDHAYSEKFGLIYSGIGLCIAWWYYLIVSGSFKTLNFKTLESVFLNCFTNKIRMLNFYI